MDELKLLINEIVTCFSKRCQFLGHNSSIHGLKYVFEKEASIFKRLFWAITLVLSSGCLYLLLGRVLRAGVEVNFTPNTLYLSWNTVFPAVTVLETYNVKTTQKKLAARYPDLVNNLNYDYRRYLTDVLFGMGSCTRSACLQCGDAIPCNVSWRDIINDVHKKCEELITDCSFNYKHFRCCDKFFPVDSDSGPGISFNSLQHMKHNRDMLFSVNQSTGPGVLTFRLLSDAQISIHSPEELSTKLLDTKFKIDVDSKYHNHVNILFSIVEVENDPLLQFETANVRGCRYLDEIPEGIMHIYPVYSNAACRLARNTQRSFEQCGCVHPVRDISYKHLYCNYTGINCLVTYEGQKAKLVFDKSYYDSCLPSCVESELTIVHTSMRRVPKQAKRGTIINIRMISLPTLRYRKNLLRNDLDLVVTVGGMLGLFFSASILSLVEAFYLIIRQQYQ